MITYRSIARVVAPRALDRIVHPEIYRWLESKGYDLADLSADWSDVGRGARASLFSVGSRERGDQRERVILREDSGYTTTLTIDKVTTSGCRLWVDIDSPGGKAPAKRPRIVKDLASQVEMYDGLSQLTHTPRVVGADELSGLYAAIEDPARRGLLFVAGSPKNFPIDSWAAFLARVTEATIGMATTIVLDGRATELFGETFGEYGTAPAQGCLRTYMPGAVLNDAATARLHRTLGTQRLVDDRVPLLSDLLENAARQSMVRVPLGPDLSHVDKVLVKARFEDLVGLTRTGETRQARATVPAGATAPMQQSNLAAPESHKIGRTHRQPEPAQGAPTPEATPFAVQDFAPALVEAVTKAVGGWATWPPDRETIEAIASLLLDGPGRRKALAEQAKEQLEMMELERDVALEDKQTSEFDRESLDIELVEAEEQLESARLEIARLRQLLHGTANAQAAYESLEPGQPSQPVESYTDALEHVAQMLYVEQYVDPKALQELEGCAATVSRPPQVLAGLRALDDYARCRNENTFNSGFRDYLANPPQGCASISLKRLASNESKSVRNNEKLSSTRRFAVPTSVDPSGYISAMAHLKFGSGSSDPRLYFHDDTAKSGKVLVLYLGRHLDVKSSN